MAEADGTERKSSSQSGKMLDVMNIARSGKGINKTSSLSLTVTVKGVITSISRQPHACLYVFFIDGTCGCS